MTQDITEAEAKERWCPAKIGNPDPAAAIKCDGSRCMVWRWKEIAILARSAGGIPTGEAPRTEISTTHGHCGLAR